MKLVVEKNLKNNNFEVKMSVEDILSEDTELISDFGEIQVNIGGKLTETVTKEVTVHNDETNTDEVKTITEEVNIANLGDSFKYLPSEFPITKVFTKAQYGTDAEKIANAYIETTKKRVTDAITALKTKRDDFSGKEEIVL